MNHRSGGNDSKPTLDVLTGGFIEAMWETLIALTMVAAICISLISLSAHLNKAKTLREAVAGIMQSTAEHRLPSVADIGSAETASHYN
jgi:hypothetical protein